MSNITITSATIRYDASSCQRHRQCSSVTLFQSAAIHHDATYVMPGGYNMLHIFASDATMLLIHCYLASASQPVGNTTALAINYKISAK